MILDNFFCLCCGGAAWYNWEEGTSHQELTCSRSGYMVTWCYMPRPTCAHGNSIDLCFCCHVSTLFLVIWMYLKSLGMVFWSWKCCTNWSLRVDSGHEKAIKKKLTECLCRSVGPWVGLKIGGNSASDVSLLLSHFPHFDGDNDAPLDSRAISIFRQSQKEGQEGPLESCGERLQSLKSQWSDGASQFQGPGFPSNDVCRLKPSSCGFPTFKLQSHMWCLYEEKNRRKSMETSLMRV